MWECLLYSSMVSTFHMDIHGLAHGDDPCIECKDIDQEPQEDSGGAMVTCSGYTTHFWVGFWMMITTWAVNMPLRNFLIGTSRGGCALFKKLGSCASATEHVLNRTWMADAGVKMKKKMRPKANTFGHPKTSHLCKCFFISDQI